MKYTIFVAYSLKGNNYTERPNLECCYHLYNSKEEAIKAVANEIECKYNNRHYHRLRVNLPKGNSNRGSFECAYTFGPLCHYDIYIQEVE